jgi:hypothetical protein
MKRIARTLAIKAATRDVRIGWTTGAILSAYRLLMLVDFARRSPAPIGLIGAVLLTEFVLVAACAVGIYRRSEGAAASLLGLISLRYVFLWYVSGSARPPIPVVTLAIAYGIYRGMRGAGELEAMPTALPRAAV